MQGNIDSISCLLLDLDGTLLGVSDENFEKHYIRYVASRFSDLIEPEPFIKALWEGTEAMLRHNNADKYVLESFFDTFTKITGIDREETFRRFDEFYRSDYAKLRVVCEPMPTSKPLVDKATELGYTVICATNPVFPQIATEQRLKWTDLSFSDFLHVTHAENSYFCKPNPEYFQSLLEMAGVKPEESLMVGNDYYFDMAASKLGIKTWMTDNYQGNLEYRDKFRVDYQGSLTELYDRL